MNLFGIETQQKNLFNYRWYLKDGFPQSLDNSVKPNNYKVFGCFLCGGGTTMGFKLAGFNHLGGVEISQKEAEVYKKNLNPKYLYNEDIRDFLKKAKNRELPSELYNLDCLEGSPPCSTFSICGEKQAAFGKEKKFSEGTKLQTLDDLVFVYAELAIILLPKVVLFENVAGFSNYYAKNHKRKVFEILSQKYTLYCFTLNAKNMGIPQSRTRFFIVAIRKDLDLDFFNLNYNEPIIPFREISDDSDKSKAALMDTKKEAIFKESLKNGKTNPFKRGDECFLHYNKPTPCLTSKGEHWHIDYLRYINNKEMTLAASFPLDYDYNLKNPNAKRSKKVAFLTGMSIPPVMAANIAYQIKIQILDKVSK